MPHVGRHGDRSVTSRPQVRPLASIAVASLALTFGCTAASAAGGTVGIRIGTPTTTAERLAHAKVSRNCLVVLRLASQRASLRIDFGGGHADTSRSTVSNAPRDSSTAWRKGTCPVPGTATEL